MKRIGIFGGTFNPIHLGHLSAATIAFKQFKLDKIKFIPQENSLHKTNLIPFHHRYQMLRLALTQYPHFQVSSWEKNGDGFFTNTLKHLVSLHSQKTNFYQFYFIIGSDTHQQISTWSNLPQILSLADFIVIDRTNISSSQIRENIKNNLPIDNLIPPEVSDYILKHQLYS